MSKQDQDLATGHLISAAKVPELFADVTADWLTAAIGLEGVEVIACDHTAMHQTKHNKTRVSATYNDAGRRFGLPDRLVVKGSFHAENPYNDRALPDQPLDVGNWLETMSYLEVLPRLRAPAPSCLAARWDHEARAGFIIMEDLAAKGARFLDVMDTLSFGEAAGFVDALAKMHAQYWDADEQPMTGLVQRSRELREAVLVNFVQLGAASREERARAGAATIGSQDHLLPRMFHDKQRHMLAAQRMFEVTDSFTRCVVHGDEHLRNLYLSADGSPGFLDWCARREGWPLSLGYFLVNCLDPLDRREWERPLLAHYLSRLQVHGATPPGLEDAWFGYRCGAMFAFLVWANNRAAWQPADTNAACTVRAATAVMDLGSFAALGV